MNQYLLSLFVLPILLGHPLFSNENVTNPEKQNLSEPEVVTYKSVKTEKGRFDLKLYIFQPKKTSSTPHPCILLIHGGGWNNGTPDRYFTAAKKWSKLGLTAISAEYRVRDIHGGDALDSVRDAKSAMRWIRSNAGKLKIDPQKIVAQGSSAGGHLAAACATLKSFNEAGEDSSIDCTPNALILKSPVLDNGPDGGYGQYKKEVRENWKEFSPFHNIRDGVPPTFLSLGTDEKKYLRVEIANQLKAKIEKSGSRCELIVLEGATHRKRTKDQHQRVEKAQVAFLKSLDFIP